MYIAEVHCDHCPTWIIGRVYFFEDAVLCVNCYNRATGGDKCGKTSRRPKKRSK